MARSRLIMAILYLAECCICTLSTPHPLRRLNSIVIVGNSEPRTRSMQDGPGQQCLLVFQGSAHAVVRLVVFAPRALRALFAAGEQRMGTLLRTLPRPLRVGRDQHLLSGTARPRLLGVFWMKT